jgi:hypothetical protein
VVAAGCLGFRVVAYPSFPPLLPARFASPPLLSLGMCSTHTHTHSLSLSLSLSLSHTHTHTHTLILSPLTHSLTQERHLMLCMSQHGRLGADSKLALLDPALMRSTLLLMCC